jgi:nucleoside-diphosphate-sugar epimerase
VYVEDVVNIALAAFENGSIGERYLALGRREDICSLPAFCNRAAELAGTPHRVTGLDPASGLDIGTMAQFAARKYPDPIMDSSATTRATGSHSRQPMHDGLTANSRLAASAGRKFNEHGRQRQRR